MYTSHENPYEASYEAFFENAYENPPYEDDMYNSNKTVRQEGLTLEDQIGLGQQRLRDEKRGSRQKAILAADSARIGKTINAQRAYFHAKSRPFALDHNKAQEPLPAAVGDLTLKQLVLQQLQDAPIVAPTPVVLPPVVAPIAAPTTMALPPVVAPVVAPAAVAPMPHFGPGKMYDIF